MIRHYFVMSKLAGTFCESELVAEVSTKVGQNVGFECPHVWISANEQVFWISEMECSHGGSQNSGCLSIR